MKKRIKSHIITSFVEVNASKEIVWKHITNVEIAHFRFPWYFRLLNIPKPIKATIIQEGVGGERVAFFDNGKRFFQSIDTWEKYKTYSFLFNPEDGFKAGYIFKIFNGVFAILKGTYFVEDKSGKTKITLVTDYAIDRNWNWLMAIPIQFILRVFQRYLLHTIQTNAEYEYM